MGGRGFVGGRWGRVGGALPMLGLLVVACRGEPNWEEIARLEGPGGAPIPLDDQGREIPTFESRREGGKGEGDPLRREYGVLIYADGRRLRHGADRAWWPDGTPKHEYHYVHDVLTGVWMQWYEDGSPKVERHYREGRATGRWRTWHGPGVPASDRWLMGRDDARWTTFWHEGGGVASQGPALDGVRTGRWSHWYTSGELGASGHYLGNQREGEWFSLWKDGSLRERGTYLAGERIGDWVSHPKGKVPFQLPMNCLAEPIPIDRVGEAQGHLETLGVEGTLERP